MRHFTPSIADVSWAESVLRLHAHNEVWFCRKRGSVYHVNKNTKTLSLLFRVQNVWTEAIHHQIVLTFVQIGWRVLIHPTVAWASLSEYYRHLSFIEREAKHNNLAVVDYGAELVRLSWAKSKISILQFDTHIDTIMNKQRQKPSIQTEEVGHALPAVMAGAEERAV